MASSKPNQAKSSRTRSINPQPSIHSTMRSLMDVAVRAIERMLLACLLAFFPCFLQPISIIADSTVPRSTRRINQFCGRLRIKRSWYRFQDYWLWDLWSTMMMSEFWGSERRQTITFCQFIPTPTQLDLSNLDSKAWSWFVCFHSSAQLPADISQLPISFDMQSLSFPFCAKVSK